MARRPFGQRALRVFYVFGIASLLAMVACNPTRLHRAARGVRLWNPSRLAGPHRVSGTSVTIVGSSDGISIETEDGGGAGHVAFPRSVRHADDTAKLEIESRGSGTFVVKVQPSESSTDIYYTRFRSDGVRLDDSLTERAGERRVPLALALFAIYYFFIRRTKEADPATPTTPTPSA